MDDKYLDLPGARKGRCIWTHSRGVELARTVWKDSNFAISIINFFIWDQELRVKTNSEVPRKLNAILGNT